MTFSRLWVLPRTLALTALVGRATLAADNRSAPPSMNGESPPRGALVGVGYHPGNFIGPLAFDVIVRPIPHLAFDLQAGYSKESLGVGRLGLAPHVQWELWRGMQTPYLGLGFRYERRWLDGVAATSTGGFLVAGWQIRWHSGFGILFGVGILYKSPLDLSTTRAVHHSDGGLFGTYEVGLRYFF